MKNPIFLAALLPVCHVAFAADAPVEFSPIIVTANRMAQTVDETLAPVTVITRDDIDRLQAQSVLQLLRGLPGTSISNNGGAGKSTSLFLRGTESDQVLVLINGVKVGSVSLGTTAFQDIPVEQIERIEIVRGPRASLYGSEAIGGVIQIFTRQGSGEVKPFLSVGAGSYGSQNASAGLSGGNSKGWFNLSASGFDTKGFDSCGGSLSAGCFTDEPDRDGYRNLSASLRGSYHFEGGVEVEAHALHAYGENDFDGGFVNESESSQQVLGGALRYSPADMWHLSFSGGRSSDKSDNFKDGDFETRFDSIRDSFSFQNDILFADEHLLILGLDYQKDAVEGTTDYIVSSRDNTAAFLQYQWQLDAQDLQLSLRQDDNEQFGKHVTNGVAWAASFGQNMRFTLAYGSAFKAPTFNELYYPGFGNAALKPEESQSIELSLKQQIHRGFWSLNIYETRVDDLIAYDANVGAPANIDQARLRGAELAVTTQLKGWQIGSSFTQLDPINRSNGAFADNVLPRRAEQALRIDADRQFNKASLGATVLAQGERFDDLANTQELNGYMQADVRFAYQFSPDWKMQARIENLFDKSYETAAFYNQPERSVYVTLHYTP